MLSWLGTTATIHKSKIIIVLVRDNSGDNHGSKVTVTILLVEIIETLPQVRNYNIDQMPVISVQT